MKRSLLVLSVLWLASGAAEADPIESCGDGRALCEAVCTPARIARYYSGVVERCTASCSPRWQQCMLTGEWVHLEDEYPGWHQPVSRF